MRLVRSDPAGLACVVMTYAAVGYADYVVVRWLVMEALPDSAWGHLHVAAFNVLVVLLLVAHSRAVFRDPGLVPLPDQPLIIQRQPENGEPISLTPPPQEGWTVCGRCQMYRPPRAHHCRICQRCVLRMDHHCPWINNCVGQDNQKYFLQFLFYVGLLAAYSLILVAICWWDSIEVDGNGRGGKGAFSDAKHHYAPSERIQATREALLYKQTRILHSVILVLESFLFGLFVCAIGCDQFEAIFSDETLVEQVKRKGATAHHNRRSPKRRSKLALLAEVCGPDHHPTTWLLPCQTIKRSSILQYPNEEEARENREDSNFIV